MLLNLPSNNSKSFLKSYIQKYIKSYIFGFIFVVKISNFYRKTFGSIFVFIDVWRYMKACLESKKATDSFLSVAFSHRM